MVRIPPDRLDEDISKVTMELAHQAFEGRMGPDQKLVVLITNLELTGDLTHVGDTNQTGNITASDTITATDFVGNVSPCSGRSSGAKPFDMPHPSKDGYRLRYVCVEGPENGVYFRGKLDGTNTIEIPEYWKELVNHDTITVQLTPYGSPNVGLYVSEIAEDKITVATDDLLSLVKSEIKCF